MKSTSDTQHLPEDSQFDTVDPEVLVTSKVESRGQHNANTGQEQSINSKNISYNKLTIPGHPLVISY